MARRWKNSSRKVKLIAALAALGLLAVIPIQFATGQTPLTLEPTDAGYIRLQMDSQGNRFRYFNPDNSLSASQTFRASSCRYTPVSPASGFNLVGLSPTPGASAVGYSTSGSAKYGLGVNTAEGTGKCTQINAPNELLTLELQNGSGQTPIAGKYIDYMELDIEWKFNATINIELYRDGIHLADSDVIVSCDVSDCGPDSADGDNNRIRVPASGTVLFDEMRLFATGGSGAAVTLEAGADGTPALASGLGASLPIPTKDSVFHVVSLGEGVLTCGAGSNIATEGAAVTLTRLSEQGDPGSNPDGSECVPINYELTRDGNLVDFLKDPTQDPNASFKVEVNAWDPETAQNPIPASTVFPPNPSGELLLWCDGTSAAPVMPTGDHFWCLVSQSAELFGGGKMQVSETVLLEGDARITRG